MIEDTQTERQTDRHYKTNIHVSGLTQRFMSAVESQLNADLTLTV